MSKGVRRPKMRDSSVGMLRWLLHLREVQRMRNERNRICAIDIVLVGQAENQSVQLEQRPAIADLLEENCFELIGRDRGPYRIVSIGSCGTRIDPVKIRQEQKPSQTRCPLRMRGAREVHLLPSVQQKALPRHPGAHRRDAPVAAKFACGELPAPQMKFDSVAINLLQDTRGERVAVKRAKFIGNIACDRSHERR